jgi:surfeit locus 1 family protein
VKGKVKIEGFLRQSAQKGRFTPENDTTKNQWYWIDLDSMAKQMHSLPIMVDLKGRFGF